MSLGFGAALLVLMWRRRGFALAIAASLALVRSSGWTTTPSQSFPLRSLALDLSPVWALSPPDVGPAEFRDRHAPELWGGRAGSWSSSPSCSSSPRGRSRREPQPTWRRARPGRCSRSSPSACFRWCSWGWLSRMASERHARVGLPPRALPAGQTMLDGDNPYPSSAHDPATGTNQVWPPAAPSYRAPDAAAGGGGPRDRPARARLLCRGALGRRRARLAGLSSRRALAARLHRARARTPDATGLSSLSPSRGEQEMRAPDPVSLSGLRSRSALRLAAPRVARPQPQAASRLLGVLVAATSLVLVIPFTGLGSYVESVLRVGRAFDQDTYTVFGLLVPVGCSRAGGATSSRGGRRDAGLGHLAVPELHARDRDRAGRVADRLARLLRDRRDPARDRRSDRDCRRSGSCRCSRSVSAARAVRAWRRPRHVSGRSPRSVWFSRSPSARSGSPTRAESPRRPGGPRDAALDGHLGEFHVRCPRADIEALRRRESSAGCHGTHPSPPYFRDGGTGPRERTRSSAATATITRLVPRAPYQSTGSV